MSVTDRYTQSQTRLHKSVTELDTATALWRRNAANAHLAAYFLHMAHAAASDQGCDVRDQREGSNPALMHTKHSSPAVL